MQKKKSLQISGDCFFFLQQRRASHSIWPSRTNPQHTHDPATYVHQINLARKLACYFYLKKLKFINLYWLSCFKSSKMIWNIAFYCTPNKMKTVWDYFPLSHPNKRIILKWRYTTSEWWLVINLRKGLRYCENDYSKVISWASNRKSNPLKFQSLFNEIRVLSSLSH